MKFPRIGASLKSLGLLLSLLAVVSMAVMAAPVNLTVLHVNDVHGRMESFANADNALVGGAARTATLIKQLRAENPNVLLLNAGDAVHGTNMVNLSKGQAVIEAMNKMGFDAMAPGNHDFNYGVDQLINLSKMANFPILASNFMSESEVNPFSSVKFASIGGLEITIIGAVTQETPILTHPDNVKGWVFSDPVESIGKYVTMFRDSSDLIIVLSHLGYDIDKQIAAKVPGIDLIVGGHSHTKLDKGETVGNTLIVQDFEYGQFLGRVDLQVEDKKVVSAKAQLIPVTAAIAEDPEVAAITADYKAKADLAFKGVVGNTAVVLNGERTDVRSKETNLGNLVADMLRSAAHTDVALMNGGGIRANINVGDITLDEVVTALPFDNTLEALKVTGAQLKAALENGVAEIETGAGRFPQVSGLSFTYKLANPKGQRVLSVTVGGAPLDPEKIYTVATNDFMAAGGDGYDSLKAGTKIMTNTGLFMRDIAAQYLRDAGTISPAIEGRIVPVQ